MPCQLWQSVRSLYFGNFTIMSQSLGKDSNEHWVKGFGYPVDIRFEDLGDFTIYFCCLTVLQGLNGTADLRVDLFL